MTASTLARRPESNAIGAGPAGLSIPLMLSCIIPILVVLASGGWIRLVASVLAVGAGAGLVADGLVDLPPRPVAGDPYEEDGGARLERAC